MALFFTYQLTSPFPVVRCSFARRTFNVTFDRLVTLTLQYMTRRLTSTLSILVFTHRTIDPRPRSLAQQGPGPGRPARALPHVRGSGLWRRRITSRMKALDARSRNG